MWREFLIVGIGSFFGGGARYIVSQIFESATSSSFPFGTFVVNMIGCFLIGFFSGFHYEGGWMTPQTKLILTTGFCGGFTTFSTFIKEGTALASSHDFIFLCLYLFGSLAVGLIAVVAGHLACAMVRGN